MSKFVIFLIVVTLAACSATLFDDLFSGFKDDDQLPFVSAFPGVPDLMGDFKETSTSEEHSVKYVNGVKVEDSSHEKKYNNDNGVETLKETNS